MAKVGVLSNLNSRKNSSRTGRTGVLQQIVGSAGLVRQTRTIGEITPVLEEFADANVDYWVGDGGDGTFHWMLNEARDILVKRGLKSADAPFPIMVPTNGGTIDFVARKAGISGSADQIIEGLVTKLRNQEPIRTVSLDTIEVRGRRPGDPVGEYSFSRLGFAAALAGIGQRFFKSYYSHDDPNAATVIQVALKAAVGAANLLPLIKDSPLIPNDWVKISEQVLSGTRARAIVDGHDFGYTRLQGGHAGSIDIEVGAVKLFRHASAPGKLHFVVGDLEPTQAVLLWPYILFGEPIPKSTWHEVSGEVMQVEALDGELLDPVIDGELFYGFEALEVRKGPTVAVPVIARPRPTWFVWGK